MGLEYKMFLINWQSFLEEKPRWFSAGVSAVYYTQTGRVN